MFYKPSYKDNVSNNLSTIIRDVTFEFNQSKPNLTGNLPSPQSYH